MAKGHLSQPFSPEERAECQRAYVRHQGLLRTLGQQFCRTYSYLDRSVVYSCIDLAFLKAFRAWDPDKGKFSTILASFARGEVRHYIRDHHGYIRLPRAHQTLLANARRLMVQKGLSVRKTAVELGCDLDLLLELIQMNHTPGNTDRIAHDTVCPRPGPMELLEAEQSG